MSGDKMGNDGKWEMPDTNFLNGSASGTLPEANEPESEQPPPTRPPPPEEPIKHNNLANMNEGRPVSLAVVDRGLYLSFEREKSNLHATIATLGDTIRRQDEQLQEQRSDISNLCIALECQETENVQQGEEFEAELQHVTGQSLNWKRTSQEASNQLSKAVQMKLDLESKANTLVKKCYKHKAEKGVLNNSLMLKNKTVEVLETERSALQRTVDKLTRDLEWYRTQLENEAKFRQKMMEEKSARDQPSMLRSLVRDTLGGSQPQQMGMDDRGLPGQHNNQNGKRAASPQPGTSQQAGKRMRMMAKQPPRYCRYIVETDGDDEDDEDEDSAVDVTSDES